jgi:hypothetical protein
MSEELGWNRGTISLAAALGALISGFSQPFVGRLDEMYPDAGDEREQPGGWRSQAGQHKARRWLLGQRRSGTDPRAPSVS